jgi:two-component system chemotaxis response regulator CheB
MINVLIVEDSRVVSAYLEEILGQEDDIRVIGNVSDGKSAIEFIKTNKPDLVTMDIDLPLMNGLEATRIIMASTPVPIIIVTASRDVKDVRTSIDALSAGALAVIEKPVGPDHPEAEQQCAALIHMVRLMAEVKVITRKFSVKRQETQAPQTVAISRPGAMKLDRTEIVAVGISTGGPVVLQKIFSAITGDFPYPIVVVQHMTDGFLEGLVSWLNQSYSIPACVATQGMQVLPGNIYFAPSRYQMGISRSGYVVLEECRRYKGICPSVAHLFNSLATNYQSRVLAMLLTGMGNDGAAELKLLRVAGSVTIAQDKKSSLIHGMPGAAIQMHAAEFIMSADEITRMLKEIETGRKIKR